MPEKTQVREGQSLSSAGCTQRRLDIVLTLGHQSQALLSSHQAAPSGDKAIALGGHAGLGPAGGSSRRLQQLLLGFLCCCSYAGYNCIEQCPAGAAGAHHMVLLRWPRTGTGTASLSLLPFMRKYVQLSNIKLVLSELNCQWDHINSVSVLKTWASFTLPRSYTFIYPDSTFPTLAVIQVSHRLSSTV